MPDGNLTGNIAEKPKESSVSLRDLLKQYLTTMLLCVIVLAVSVAFTVMEDWLQRLSVSSWLVMGMHFLAILCFITDAIVVLIASLTVTVKVVSDMLKALRDEGSNGAKKP